MNITASFLLVLGLAYLFGSIPFGKFIGKHHGIDIQKHGSGNIGFANVLRTLGWQAGLIVLAGDIMKGFIPVYIANQYLSTYQILAVALVAILGHIFPVWLKFKGGKGIATGLGATLALSPLLGGLGIATYLITLSIFRKSAPASVMATWSLVLFSLAILPSYYAWFYLGIGLLATWTHRDNIKQILMNKA
jgi:glycerol-3-phosphate acyltransferase PlsY